MKAALAWFLNSWLGRLIVTWVWDKLVGWATDYLKRIKRDKEIEERTKQEAESLKNSQTDDEDERAAKEILSRR